MEFDSLNKKLEEKGSNGKLALILGVIGLAASAFGYFQAEEQFYFSYLTAFFFWGSIALGSLFFTMVKHLTNATWSVVLRRISEAFMAFLPLMIIFFIPIIFGMKHLYHWTDVEAVKHDALLTKKVGYLNTTFFYIRSAVYLIVWTVLARVLYKASVRQDTEGHSDALDKKIKGTSAAGIILFALTITYAAFDWLMSLDPHWFSTIYGVYIFGGAFLAAICSITLVALSLESKGILEGVITTEHHHDLGKMMFAFVVFWSYIAFSQFFLIWYANIPEETIWFLHRVEGSWKTITLLLVYGHFLAPFLLLMPRFVKRRSTALKVMAIWILFMHWVDLYWNVLPNFSKHGVHFHWLDLSTMLGIGGIFVWHFWKTYRASSPVPVNDPKLSASIEFTNF